MRTLDTGTLGGREGFLLKPGLGGLRGPHLMETLYTLPSLVSSYLRCHEACNYSCSPCPRGSYGAQNCQQLPCLSPTYIHPPHLPTEEWGGEDLGKSFFISDSHYKNCERINWIINEKTVFEMPKKSAVFIESTMSWIFSPTKHFTLS